MPPYQFSVHNEIYFNFHLTIHNNSSLQYSTRHTFQAIEGKLWQREVKFYPELWRVGSVSK